MNIEKEGLFKLPEQSGMFRLDKREICLDPGHHFPTHMHIPYGHGYRHVCPRCGNVIVVKNDICFRTGDL